MGHLDLDMHNSNPKYIEKFACLTPQERGSFARLLVRGGGGGGRDEVQLDEEQREGKFVDAFRYFYPSKLLRYPYIIPPTYVYYVYTNACTTPIIQLPIIFVL
ncbi:hypothetical protein EON63_25130 [archaeon]|nr:MAG: hypothetical protein EON63_25130 [archaeon]